MVLSFSINFSSLDEFLDHWSKRYPDVSKDAEKYDPFVGKPLSKEALKHLFEWKNGSEISAAKQAGIIRYYPLKFDKDKLQQRYLDANAGGGPIWNIFYMHCIDPERWPIYDQHTHRAMSFMITGSMQEIGKSNSEKYRTYELEYVPFVKTLGSNRRIVDRALSTFGQFLKIAKRYQ